MYWGAFGEASVGDASPFELGMLLSISYYDRFVSYLDTISTDFIFLSPQPL